MLRRIIGRWKAYRYRFVPWIALNLKDRKVRSVDDRDSDSIISDAEAGRLLLEFVMTLEQHSGKDVTHTCQKYQKSSHKNCSNESTNCDRNSSEFGRGESTSMRRQGGQFELLSNRENNETGKGESSGKRLDIDSGQLKKDKECKSHLVDTSRRTGQKLNSLKNAKRNREPVDSTNGIRDDLFSHSKQLDVRWSNAEELYRRNMNQDFSEVSERNLDVMFSNLGYRIERQESNIPGGGRGVKVTRGRVPKHQIVAMYPGTLYYPAEPIFFQSLGNPFIFRCIDRVLIDGNDKAVSKVIFRSCSNRDRVGPYLMSDTTWLTDTVVNPLAVGQYVNNQTSGFPANVAYQEYDLPADFSFTLRKYIPNVYYSPAAEENSKRLIRTVLLVSLREIEEGEELFSTYFTVVH